MTRNEWELVRSFSLVSSSTWSSDENENLRFLLSRDGEYVELNERDNWLLGLKKTELISSCWFRDESNLFGEDEVDDHEFVFTCELIVLIGEDICDEPPLYKHTSGL